MAKAIDTLSIKLDLGGLAGGQALIDKLKSSFKGLEQVISGNTAPAIRKLRQQVNDFAAQGNRSINTIESQVTALRALRREADINSKEFKELTADIKKYEAQLSKVQGRSRGGGGGALRATQTAGAVVSGGIFGGPEGAIGALLGAPFGVPGAFAGAAIGAQVGGVRQALGGAAEYAADLAKLRIALKGVTTSQKEYQQALSFIQQTTKDFAIPQEIVTKQFTKLQASVQGAGGDLEDTKTAFNGIVAAVRATGGSLADVDSALTATAQVFSKGKVSAEELRQQIGERLPGAFTLFAQSMGLTPQELDKALEKGQVSLQDFQRFAEAIFNRYGENAKQIASAPEAAGDRLKVTLGELKAEVGQILAPIGAEFQQTFAGIAESILNAVRALNRFFGLGGEARKNALITQVNATNAAIAKAKRNVVGFRQEIAEKGDFGGQRQRLVQSELNLISELETRREGIRDKLNRITRGDAISIEQPKPGDGLPGVVPKPLGGGGGAGRQDITAAAADAQIAALRLREKDKLITEEQIRAAADLARKAAEVMLPQERRVALAKIEVEEANQLAARYKQISDIGAKMGADLAKQMIDQDKLNRELRISLEDRKYQLGLITEEEHIQNQLLREREALKARGASEEQIKQQTDLLKKILTETPIDKFIRDATKSLTDLQSRAVSVAQAIGDAVGQALSNGIQSLIEGTSNIKEQFANLLKSIGQILIQEGTKMIATYIAIGVARAFGLGLQGGGMQGFKLPLIGDFFTQSFGRAANGGPVQSGRPYLVGEQGPELFLPSQSGRVKSNEDMRRLMGRSPASAATQMNFTFETTNIGGTEYVSREQLELAMATTRRQAANDGATRGMNMTLDRMQNSPRTRARVGIA